MINYRVVEDDRGLHDLREDWGRLLAQSLSPNAFLTFDWLATWWKHFKGGKELFVVVAEEEGKVVGIAPLAATRSRLGRKLRFLGRPGSDYSDLIWSEGHVLDVGSLLEFIQRTWDGDLILLEGIPEDSSTFKPLMAAFQQVDGNRSHRVLYTSTYLSIDRRWEEYRGTLRKKLVQDTERQMRRLRERGELVFGRCADAESAGPLIAEVIRHKRARYRATGAKDIFNDGRLSAFYHEIAGRFLSKGWLDLSYLKLDDTVLAAHFGFVYGNRFYYYMPSFRPEYAVYSPSRVLIYHQIRSVFQDGLTEYDFLGGDDHYKREWATETRVVHAFAACTDRPYSRLAYRFHTRLLPGVKGSPLVKAAMRRLRRRAAKIL